MPDRYVVQIKNAKPEDSGLYTCRARNDAGTSTTSARVFVDEPQNFNVGKPSAKYPNEFLSDNEWTAGEAQIRRDLERRQRPYGWSQKDMDDFMYRVSVANYHIKYRTPISEYYNLF